MSGNGRRAAGSFPKGKTGNRRGKAGGDLQRSVILLANIPFLQILGITTCTSGEFNSYTEGGGENKRVIGVMGGDLTWGGEHTI